MPTRPPPSSLTRTRTPEPPAGTWRPPTPPPPLILNAPPPRQVSDEQRRKAERIAGDIERGQRAVQGSKFRSPDEVCLVQGVGFRVRGSVLRI
jgi:hypothetical protein